MQRGSAIECRIYAEDPENNFLPSPGRIEVLRVPSGIGIRDDSGVYEGFEVSTFYDPIISKLVAWGSDRDEAIGRMLRALRRVRRSSARRPTSPSTAGRSSTRPSAPARSTPASSRRALHAAASPRTAPAPTCRSSARRSPPLTRRRAPRRTAPRPPARRRSRWRDARPPRGAPWLAGRPARFTARRRRRRRRTVEVDGRSATAATQVTIDGRDARRRQPADGRRRRFSLLIDDADREVSVARRGRRATP